MNAVEEIICTGCDREIDGEYVVKQRDGREEHYHPNCAKALKVGLPVRIRFKEELK